jgi:hypothetical protein
MAPWGNKRIRRAAIVLVSACALGLGLATSAGATPSPPVLSGTNPASPANANQILVIGTAEAGSTVNLYPDANCSGSPYPSGSAAIFASPGLQVQVPDNSTTTMSATAVDVSSTVSACSAPITFVEDSKPPNTFIRRIRVPNRTQRIIARFRSNESRARFQCRADPWRPFGRCGGVPRSVRAGLGRHRFQVRAIDAAGNVDPTPASRVVVVHGNR